MTEPGKTFVDVAVIQSAPVLFDKSATIEKTCDLIRDAADLGSRLILLPEAFIPAYPRGFSFGMVVGSRNEEGRRLWKRYWENAVTVPGQDVERLGKAAKDACAYVAVGIIEKDGVSGSGTLYCTTLYFGPEGNLLGIHRKLKPTGSERLIWGEGDGSTLPVISTPFGRIGGLTCWENYMPLARMAMYAQGVEIYLAPTADSRDTWQATMRHIACEGRCFVLGCNQYVTKDMYPDTLETIEELDNQPQEMCPGGSVIVSPFGEVIAGPVFGRERILHARLDMSEVARSKLDFDVVGHYARPDLFELTVNTSSQPAVRFKKD
ncbi:MAG: carbon-nitrogen hydrolase family protein [Desulfobacteraceae bacterium]|nr:MAG: carbon-nitrogen hydrolase family protein [Desulfobacteraceae bacterium]